MTGAETIIPISLENVINHDLELYHGAYFDDCPFLTYSLHTSASSYGAKEFYSLAVLEKIVGMEVTKI